MLTPAFLAEILRRPVDDVAVERIGVDRGFAGTVLRVMIGAADRPPLTVVAKVGPDPALDREVSFYRDLAGQLAAPTARCWYAGPSPDGTPIVVLEDLGDARPGDALDGADVEDAAAVLTAMVPVWSCKPTDSLLATLPRWGGDPVRRQERFCSNWASQREQLEGELTKETWQIGERLRKSLAAVAVALQSGPAAALHADLHLDNVLFRTAAETPLPVVLDWGALCTGPSAIDIFPFVAMSLSTADHIRYASDLLADLGLRDEDFDAGRRRLLCYFAGVVGWRNRPPGAHPRERALCAAALDDGRLVNALLQWDAASVI